MKIFLDTLELSSIQKYSDMGILAGVTTNPTLAKRHGMDDDIDMIKKIRGVMPVGEINVEAWGTTKDEILSNI
jgi:transaldolase